MDSLKLYGVRDIRFEKAEEPIMHSDNDVIVKIKAAGICGSDVSRYRLLGPYIIGMIWGHEFSGEVVAIGKAVTNVSINDRVVGCPVVFDGEDYYYKKGEFNRSDFNNAIGAKRPGAFAEYICLPSQNLVKIPNTLSFDAASLVEPSSVVIHGLYRTSLTVGKSVAIVGAGGTLGLIAIQWAKIFGVGKIIAIDIDDAKLELSKKVGADVVINSLNEDTEKLIAKNTDGLKADLVIEAAGSPITASQVFAYAKKGGEILFLGIPYGDVHVKRYYFEKILRSELTVFGSWSNVSAPFPGKEWSDSVKFFAEHKINTEHIVTHRLPLSKGPEIFKKLMERKELIGKVILHPDEK
ncbi:L-iditol 2-dehydrogenase [Propionispira arboris]|uniref:L-iditol 2-dehydrogenase n=1 Tax=Propionispira arboris TaxID=84035 RepID=A0A1H7CZ36_9FIRM|nr:galactitol-1-phosphate 5-dehydrogenase [Propionispira arboris]SEJ94859.1 L-iditol 2-dehydrogenase [Propionispira arboris]